ncbi:MAG: terminase small subunit [Leptospirillum sp.]
MSQLTQKQEAFCLAYLETGNASEAYRRAYDAGKMKENTIGRKAFALLQDGKITARIDSLRSEAAKVAVLTQASVISDLIRVKDHAMTLDEKGMMIKPDIAVRALELLGKNVQAWAPETQVAIQINGSGSSFEEALEKVMVITVTGGFSDSEESLQKEKDSLTGRLYSLWKNGQPLPETVTIGGLPSDLFADVPVLN